MTNSPDKPKKTIAAKAGYVASVMLEHLLLGISIALIIPPIPSMEGQRYYFDGRNVFVILLFLVPSRLLAMGRHEESWLGLVLKAAILGVAGYVNFERIFS